LEGDRFRVKDVFVFAKIKKVQNLKKKGPGNNASVENN